MDSLILLIIDKEDFALVGKYYTSSYRISNDVQSLDSSEFELDISDDDANLLKDSSTVRNGNLLFVDIPGSLFGVDVSAFYMGVIRSFENKKIETDHFYSLFDVEGAPTQVNAKNTPIKDRLVYEWLPLVLNGVVYTAGGAAFRYNEKYDPLQNDIYLNGHKRYIVEGTPNVGEYSVVEGYQMDTEQGLESGSIVSDYLDRAAGYEHIVVTPRLTTGFTNLLNSSYILKDPYALSSTYSGHAIDDGCEIRFTVGQYSDKTLVVNDAIPFIVEPKPFTIYMAAALLQDDGSYKYKIYSAPILPIEDKYISEAGRVGVIPTTDTGGFAQHIAYNGYNRQIAYEGTNPTSHDVWNMWFYCNQHQLANLYTLVGKSTEYRANPKQLSAKEIGEVLQSGSYIWPTVANDGWAWTDLTGGFDFIDDNPYREGGSWFWPTMQAFACTVNWKEIITNSDLISAYNTLYKKIKKYATEPTAMDSCFRVEPSLFNAVSFYKGNTYTAIINDETGDYKFYSLNVCLGISTGPYYMQPYNKSRLQIDIGEEAYSILGKKYYLRSSLGSPILKIKEGYSFIKNIQVSGEVEKVNAVYFYNGASGKSAVTNSRVYLKEDDTIIQNQDAATSTTTLDIPEDVRTPLTIKHVIMNYTDEESTAAKKAASDRTYAASELSRTNDSDLEITVEMYQNSDYDPKNLRIGMVGDVYVNGKQYENLLLTSIEVDTSKTYFTLKFGAHRATVYTMLKPLKRNTKKR